MLIRLCKPSPTAYGEQIMRTVEECRQCADRCRAWAAIATIAEDKRIVLEMAETWDMIADEREATLNKDSGPLP